LEQSAESVKMLATKLLVAGVAFFLLLYHCGYGATIRDSSGRQINFPDSETIPESEVIGGGGQSRGFLTRIFDMIKNLLGFDTRTTIVRPDGTIEEVDVPSSGGFLSRIGKRILGFINSILSVFTGSNDSPRLDGYSSVRGVPARTSNEIERELMKLSNSIGNTNIPKS